jgi:hypothetical protein
LQKQTESSAQVFQDIGPTPHEIKYSLPCTERIYQRGVRNQHKKTFFLSFFREKERLVRGEKFWRKIGRNVWWLSCGVGEGRLFIGSVLLLLSRTDFFKRLSQ